MLIMNLPTHFNIHSGIFCPLMLCSKRAGSTLSMAPVMLSDSSVATLSLLCHVAWICWTGKSSAVSIDLSGQAPMC
jgi:hypothetical protein